MVVRVLGDVQERVVNINLVAYLAIEPIPYHARVIVHLQTAMEVIVGVSVVDVDQMEGEIGIKGRAIGGQHAAPGHAGYEIRYPIPCIIRQSVSQNVTVNRKTARWRADGRDAGRRRGISKDD